MEEKEALLVEIKQLITESTKETVKKTDVDEKIKSINDKIEKLNLDNDGLKALKDSVDQLVKDLNQTSLELKSMKEDGIKKDEPKSFRQILKDSILEKKDQVLIEKNDDYGKRLSMKEWFTDKGNQTTPTFILKDAVDMLESNIAQNYVSTLRLTDLDPMRVGTPLTIYPHVIDVMKKKRISKPNMALLVVYSYTDGTGVKTEGSASSKSSFLFKTVSFPAFYIATHFTLSDETLDDLEEALDEISAVAPDKINDKIDTYILGTTGDDSTAIAGLFTANKCTSFNPASYANFAEGATLVDLVAAMKLNAETNKYKPDSVWLNPDDFTKAGAIKNSLKDSVNDRRVVFNALGEPIAICGLMVRKSTAITANTCAVVDSNQPWIGIRKDMTMEIAYNGTDLTEGQKTVVIKARVAFGVRDKAGVIYCDNITSDISSISIP